MNRMSKNPVYAKIDFTGKVTEIVNGKMLANMILKDTSAITLADPVGSALKNQIANMVSDNSLKQLSRCSPLTCLVKQSGSGDKWSFTTSTNAGGMSLDITTSYKLDVFQEIMQI